MTSILDRYGIKEVADVAFREIDENGDPQNTVLFLDSLKISTIEETAEQVEARGGKGNAPLVIWDYGKEINVSIQDALYSPRSMALMHNDEGNFAEAPTTITRYYNWKVNSKASTFAKVQTKIIEGLRNGGTNTSTTPTITNIVLYGEDGGVVTDTSSTFSIGERYIVQYEVTPEVDSVIKIDINASTFPGTYYVVGDTFARSDVTGKDQYFQFTIYKAKMSAEKTITLEAEGDPSVFDMNLRVMRPDDGVMMSLVQYEL